MSTKNERRRIILDRADKHAMSGKFSRWLLIEHHLIGEGYPEARQILDNKIIRVKLDRLCREARESGNSN